MVFILAAFFLRIRRDQDRVSPDLLVEGFRRGEQEAQSLLEGHVFREQRDRHALDRFIEDHVDAERLRQKLERLLEIGLAEVERDRRLRGERQALEGFFLILLLEFGEGGRRFLVVRIHLEGPLELASGVVKLAGLMKVQPFLIEIRRLLAGDRIGHHLLQLAMVGHRSQSVLKLHDGLVEVALFEKLLSPLIIEIGRLELGLLEARAEFDVAGAFHERLAVFEDRFQPFVLRGIFLRALDGGRSTGSEQRDHRKDGKKTQAAHESPPTHARIGFDTNLQDFGASDTLAPQPPRRMPVTFRTPGSAR